MRFHRHDAGPPLPNYRLPVAVRRDRDGMDSMSELAMDWLLVFIAQVLLGGRDST